MATPIKRPFIMRFAIPIGRAESETLRYDEERQLSQILIDGAWFDASTARMPAAIDTRLTKVHQETTDDV